MASPQTLPTELERYILEIAAFIHPECMPVLVLVARRAKIWIEPLLYQVIRVDPRSYPGHGRWIPLSTILRLIDSDSKPPSFFHDHVRHICLLDLPEHQLNDIMRVFSICDATVNLQLLRGSPNLLPLLGAMSQLHRLSAVLSELFPGPTPDFSHPIFTKITHLDVFDSPHGWELWSGLAHMPCLTHLSFYRYYVDHAFCHSALQHCKSLQVLAILCLNHLTKVFAPDYETLASDPRFVMVGGTDRTSDWDKAARGGQDHWVRVDEFVRKRLSGETKEWFIKG
ncbi:hypothetical protein C8R44DRAFT_808821 [Mycena epipterygia]|nr:hypothetical protein C8R44DRAFT_808821 [Mycena epipterygia]